MKIKLRRLPRRIYWKHRFKSYLKNTTITRRSAAASWRFGLHGLKILESCKVQWFHFEALRKRLLPFCKNRIPLQLHVNLNIPLTTKPGMRMGSGKGKLKNWVGNLKRGEIFLEFGVMTFNDRLNIITALRGKLPFKCQFISRMAILKTQELPRRSKYY